MQTCAGTLLRCGSAEQCVPCLEVFASEQALAFDYAETIDFYGGPGKVEKSMDFCDIAQHASNRRLAK